MIITIHKDGTVPGGDLQQRSCLNWPN